MIALSFGGGRQTTAIICLVAQGELPKPDIVLFADTDAEWPETYDYIKRYVRPELDKMGIPFVTVMGHDYGCDNLYDWHWKLSMIPLPMQRRCTDKFKVRPLIKMMKAQGVTEEWIGFSFDEQGRASRKRPIKGIISRFPLIEQRMTVADCMEAIRHQGWPAPFRSACYFCCFQTPAKIRRLYQQHPDLAAKVEALETRARNRKNGCQYYLVGEHPVSWYAVQQGDMFDNDVYGCQDGYCLR